MSNEITQDAAFRPQDYEPIGSSTPPIGNGMMAVAGHLLAADDRQVSLLFNAHAHYSIGAVAGSGIENQFGSKAVSYSNKPLLLFLPPFTNRASVTVAFEGSGSFNIKYGSSYAFNYGGDLANEVTGVQAFITLPGTPNDSDGLTFTDVTTGLASMQSILLDKGAGLQINALIFTYYRSQYNIT